MRDIREAAARFGIQVPDIPRSVSDVRRLLGLDGRTEGQSPVQVPTLPKIDFKYPDENPNNHALNAMLGRKDPLPNILWYVDMPVINGTILGWEYVEKINMPMYKNAINPFYKAGNTNSYAGIRSLESVSLTAYEDSSRQASDYFEVWQNLVMDQQGFFEAPNKYKKSITVFVMDMTRKVIIQKTYKGVWPSGINTYELEADGTNRITTQVELSVDSIDYSVAAYSQKQLPQIVFSTLSDFPAGLGAAFGKLQRPSTGSGRDGITAGLGGGLEGLNVGTFI